MSRSNKRFKQNRGGALLAVLWLSAALSAIAFSVASSVRAETERASTLSESIRAGYLASGAVEGAILKIQGARNSSRLICAFSPYCFASMCT